MATVIYKYEKNMENESKMLKSLLDERKNDSAQFIVCKKMSTQKKKLE